MADFDPQIPQGNDPDYASWRYTIGTSRATLQPLAQQPRLNPYPIEAHPRPDVSAGVGIKGVGEVADAATKLTNNVIQQKASDTLEKGLNNIRDGFIASQTLALGQNLNEGKSLIPTGSDPNVPVPVQKVTNRIQGLQDAYHQGALDDTSYWGKMNAYVKQVKTQFPGYSDYVDQKVSNIVGTTPANALRSSQQRQIQKYNSLAMAQQNRQDQWLNHNMGLVETVSPGYFANKAKGVAVPDFNQVQAEVAPMLAQEYKFKAQDAALANAKGNDEYNSTQASTIATGRLDNLASGIVLKTTNAMGLNSLDDIENKIQSRLATNKPFSPDEQTQIGSALSLIDQQYKTQALALMNNPLHPGQTQTYASYIHDPAKVAALIEQGRMHIKNLQDTLTNNQFGLFGYDTRWNKATTAADVSSILKTNGAMRTINAARPILGNQFLTNISAERAANGKTVGSIIANGLVQLAQAQAVTPSTPNDPHSLNDTYRTFRDEGNFDPQVWRAAQSRATNAIINKDELLDKSGAVNAVQYLYGPKNQTLWNDFKANPGSQMASFTNLFSPQITNAVKQMDTTSQATYYHAADQGFSSVLGNQALIVEQRAKNFSMQGYELTFDPNTHNFAYQRQAGRPLYPRAPLGDGLDLANGTLIPLNAAINSIKPIWEAQHRDINSSVYQMLPSVGIYPQSPVYTAVEGTVSEETKNPPEIDGTPKD